MGTTVKVLVPQNVRGFWASQELRPVDFLKNSVFHVLSCRSQWPRGLRRRSAAARLLRSWVRIPPGLGCLSVVSVLCCQVEVSATN